MLFASLVTSASFAGFSMKRRTIITVLFLALLGISGCVPAVFHAIENHQTIQPKSPEPPDLVATPAPAGALVPSLEPLAPIERSGETKEHLASSLDSKESAFNHNVTGDKITRDKLQTPTLSQREREAKPSIKPTGEPESASQKAGGPEADDGLSNLVDKDIDKAVEQPPQHRRLQFSKAVIEHPRVRHYIREFSVNQKDYFAKTLARSGRYFPMIAGVLREEGLPEELAYLALVESNFFPQASSRAGAVGLWQFIPATGRRYALRIDSWVDERRDPAKATRAAAAYLKNLHDYFGRWFLATAAYNAGEGTINRALRKSGATDFWTLKTKAKLSEETRNFVPKFVAAALIGSDPQKYGFNDLSYESPLEYEEVEVAGNLSLAGLATLAGTDLQTMRMLNLELLRSRTPPGENQVRLKVPAGHAASFMLAYQKRMQQPPAIVTHEVKKGETLIAIARRYGQEVRSLIELNGLTSPHRLQIGQKLKIIVDELRGRIR